MASATASISIKSRIEWCQRQSVQACAPLEVAGWHAEEDGLWDALLNRDHTTQYQQGPPAVLERYVLGLQDGHAMLRTAAIDLHFASPTRTVTTRTHAGLDGGRHVSTIHVPGRTQRGEPYV